MLIPIRCFTCGALIADKQEEFDSKVREGEDPGKVLTSLKVTRYCCRSILLSSADVIDQVLPYYESLAERRSEFSTE